MKKLLYIFPLFFSLIIIGSCQPGRDESGDLLFGLNNNPQNGGGGSSGVVKYLKTVTAQDDAGETVTFTYSYQLGKLMSVRSSDQSVSYDLAYDNNNISKIKIIQDDGSLVTTSSFDLTYDNGKFLEAKGTGTEDTGNSFKTTITAVYTNSKISRIVSKMVGIDSADPNLTYEMFTLQSDIAYSANNISTWKFTSFFPPTIPLPPVVISASFSDYDAKVNPFKNLPEAFNIISSLYGIDNTAVTGFSANNYRKVTVEGETATYVYTYDTAGYPTKAVASNNLGTLSFEYQ